jgi:transposase
VAGNSVKAIKKKFKMLSGYLQERTVRAWAAAEALGMGRGGISAVAAATGLSRTTVHTAVNELISKPAVRPDMVARQRKPGGGRQRLTRKDPALLEELDRLIDPATRGDPESPLRWTSKSTTKLAAALTEAGHPISQRTVCDLLAEMGYSLQSVRKSREGAEHPDRDAQFQYIDRRVKEYLRASQPVISVDTKKKELVGDFKNPGREWQPKGRAEKVRVHDFADPRLGKVTPYGVYDLAANQGWVSVGVDHDTAEFAVESIRRWWRWMGRLRYPRAKRMLITADGGGSNGSRVRLWKVALQRLVNEIRIPVSVCHFPPGTSKWNKIEHRMFCHISQNWRGRPLVSREVIIALIGSTTTKQGLKIKAVLDERPYEAGIKVSKAELAQVKLEPADFHGEWNYTIRPQNGR